VVLVAKTNWNLVYTFTIHALKISCEELYNVHYHSTLSLVLPSN